MNKISTAFTISYYSDAKFTPMIAEYNDSIACAYGIHSSVNKLLSKDVREKLITTAVPNRFGYCILNPLRYIFHFPKYYNYLYANFLFDNFCSKKMLQDHSNILFTTSLLAKTIKIAKKYGKFIVIFAGNSEPEREFQRVVDEYTLFNINNKYIYGDTRFRDVRISGFAMADKILTISEVSQNTYLKKGYDRKKLHLIPLTGTNFPIFQHKKTIKRERAFISTAFHNFVKGTHRLLLAWKEADVDNIPLIIVGKICEDIQEFINKYGPFKNVTFTGHQHNLKEFYEQYDAVGILLSLSEGAVRVTPEMMSFGFPMIVSPDATCDLVVDGINGFIVEPFDKQAIINKLQWFANDWNNVTNMNASVISTVKHRTMRDFSLEVGNYLTTLNTKE